MNFAGHSYNNYDVTLISVYGILWPIIFFAGIGLILTKKYLPNG